ncbi:unnamed protein product [Auanema sp. JU1783]|nr:unnamed protein product [Auanema sp. JU1783]
MKMTEEEKSIYSTTFLSDNFGDLFTPQMMEQFNDKLQSFCGEEHSKLINQYHDLMIERSSKESYIKLDALPDKLGYKKVFTHGDLWSTNILWTKPNENYEIRAHIDFQTASFNSSALDLARTFTTCLSADDRRNHHKELLSTFYSYLREEVEELPYTLEQLEESYHYFLPHATFVVVPMIDSIYNFMQAERPELKLASKSALIKKCVALMEDGVESNNR